MTTIFITGANRGIGLELVHAYKAQGAAVFVGVRNPGAAPLELERSATVLSLDVADDRSVATLAESLAGQPIDILINNAGILGPDRQSVLDMDFPGFLDTLNVNTLGPPRVTQTLLPNLLLSENRPRIAVLTSQMGSLNYAKSDQQHGPVLEL